MIQDVGQFDVSVQDFVPHESLEAIEYLKQNVHCLGFCKGFALKQVLQVAVLTLLHDQVDGVLRVDHFYQPYNVRVVFAQKQRVDFIFKQFAYFASQFYSGNYFYCH